MGIKFLEITKVTTVYFDVDLFDENEREFTLRTNLDENGDLVDDSYEILIGNSWEEYNDYNPENVKIINELKEIFENHKERKENGK